MLIDKSRSEISSMIDVQMFVFVQSEIEFSFNFKMPLIEEISSSSNSELPACQLNELLLAKKSANKLDVSCGDRVNLSIIKQQDLSNRNEECDDGFMSDNSERSRSGCESGIFSNRAVTSSLSSSPVFSKKMIVEIDDNVQGMNESPDGDPIMEETTNESNSELGSSISLSCDGTSEGNDLDTSNVDTCSSSSSSSLTDETEVRDNLDCNGNESLYLISHIFMIFSVSA